MEEQPDGKRLRPEAAAMAPAPPAPAPSAWPSASTLYANGLEQRAEAVGTGSWAINGQQWRASGFDAADAGGATLKQRQAEARRAMLAGRRPT